MVYYLLKFGHPFDLEEQIRLTYFLMEGNDIRLQRFPTRTGGCKYKCYLNNPLDDEQVGTLREEYDLIKHERVDDIGKMFLNIVYDEIREKRGA